MAAIKVTEVFALAADVLEVHGKVAKRPLVAYGWQSALTNHYDPDSLAADGQRKDDAEPREMSKAEQLDYCRSLLQAVVDAEPKPLPISG